MLQKSFGQLRVLNPYQASFISIPPGEVGKPRNGALVRNVLIIFAALKSDVSQPEFTYLKLTIETLAQGVKYVQSQQ